MTLIHLVSENIDNGYDSSTRIPFCMFCDPSLLSVCPTCEYCTGSIYDVHISTCEHTDQHGLATLLSSPSTLCFRSHASLPFQSGSFLAPQDALEVMLVTE